MNAHNARIRCACFERESGFIGVETIGEMQKNAATTPTAPVTIKSGFLF